jgi:thiamine pyrophosphate-dependent acetolactate synthase large subunit-like protein
MSQHLEGEHAPPTISCAEATLRSMVDLGARKLFNIPGRGVYPLLNELPKFPELEYITSLHEFPLAAIADGYARGSGEVAWLNLYMSTGVLNAASATFLSLRDRVPMVITATQAESWAIGADHRAEISDILEAVRPVTKWAWMPPTPDRVPEALRRAYSIAMTPPYGPTFVAIPVDFWGTQIQYRPPARTEFVRPTISSDQAAIADVAARLLAANHPCVVAGWEALGDQNPQALREVCELVGATLIAEPEPPRLPAGGGYEYYGGSVPEAAEALEEADLVVHLGVNTYEAFHSKIFESGGPKTHIWVNNGGLELNKVVFADVAIEGPVGPIVSALCKSVRAGVPNPDEPRIVARRAQVRKVIEAERQPLLEIHRDAWDSSPLSVARVCAELREHLPPETIVVDHSTTAVRLVREFLPVPDGNQYISASGSCQGWGLGAAVGVQLAAPDTPVVGLVGDGGFMFGVQAVWTAVQYSLPLLVVILDNGGWGSMQGSLARLSPAVAPTGRPMHFGWQSDYAKLSESLGAASATINTIPELKEVLATHLPLTAPLVLDVRCRRETKTSRSPYVGY